jgi:hypothetical protein
MSRHARPSPGRGGGLLVALAFGVLAVGAYLADAVESSSQRPAIGFAALAGAAVALGCARAQRQVHQRIAGIVDGRRRDMWRLRSELDEAHARTLRGLERAIAAETEVRTLRAAMESVLVARPVLPATLAVPVPVAPAAPPVAVEAPSVPAVAVEPPSVPAPVPEPAAQALPVEVEAPGVPAPVLEPVGAASIPALIWPFADRPAPQREPSLHLPLVPARGARNPPPADSTAARAAASSTTASTSGTEPAASPDLVDLTSTSTSRYARPA